MEKIILIVEDDMQIIEGLQDILEKYGYRVMSAQNRENVMDILKQENICLILMDVNLGRDNGFELCREIRMTYTIPILFLTGYSSEMDLVRGFQLGGDDYITKPFRVQELILRIQAVLKRTDNKEEMKKSGDILCKYKKHQVFKGKDILELTGTEYTILVNLLECWPGILSRQDLLYLVWDKDANFVEANTLNVYMSRLREKLGNYEGKPYIETIRGVGYQWNISVKGL